MIDLTTSYMGFTLKNPLVVSASPLGQSLNAMVQAEEAGAAAIVLHSLFEEQIRLESEDLDRVLDGSAESYPEALTYFPDMADYNLGPKGYLEHIREAKMVLGVPLIASLNGARSAAGCASPRRSRGLAPTASNSTSTFCPRIRT
jgi:dihydroorotate dehydrogenase (fumarate)